MVNNGSVTLPSRRTFLKGSGVLGGVILGAPVLAACSDSSTTSGGGLQEFPYLLSWIKTVQFGGCYIADDRGYYKDAGFKVELRAGGPQVTAPPLLVSAAVDIATTTSLKVAAARKDGAKLKIIGGRYQKSPAVLATLASSGITTPDGLRGKRIGVTPASEPTVTTFLQENGIDAGDVTFTPVQTGLGQLVNEDVDAIYTLAPSVATLTTQGIEVSLIYLSDYALADLAEVYAVTESTLANKHDDLVSFMKAEVQGWQDFADDLELAVSLTLDKYAKGTGLDREEQLEQAKIFKDIMVTGDIVQEKGLFWVSPEARQSALNVAEATGITLTEDDLFDDSVLTAVHGS